MQAPTLFDYAATQGRAGRHDGPTQKAAAKAMTGPILRDQQALVLEAIAGRDVRGANAHEVQTWLRDRGRNAPERNAIGTRCRELVDLGMIRLDRTRPGPTGQPEKVYVATEVGRRFIRERLEAAS